MQRDYLQKLKEEELQQLTENSILINSFKKFALKKGIQLTNDNFQYVQTIGVVACYPNIVEFLCSNVKKDKEGLFDFSELCRIYERKVFAEGLLYSKDFILMAHPHFRRGLYDKNNFAPRFIELFWKENFCNIGFYIALDCNRVRINVDNRSYKEFDTWFGAKFDKNMNSIPDGTVHLRPPSKLDSSDIAFFFNSAFSLDIKWETKDSIKTVQSEEFKTENITILKDDKIFHPVRYTHAEFDLNEKCFRHFDGAIHYYTPEEYFSRKDSDFNYNSKSSCQIKTLSEKLFKMNGKFDVDVWIKFTSHFMTGNPLVFEYFEGKYPENVENILTDLRNKKY